MKKIMTALLGLVAMQVAAQDIKSKVPHAEPAQSGTDLHNHQTISNFIPGGCSSGDLKVGNRQRNVVYIIDGNPVRLLPLASRPVLNKPLPDIDRPTSFKLTGKEIQTLPATDLRDMVALSPSVYQQHRSADVNISGSNIYGTLYIIDGMQIAR